MEPEDTTDRAAEQPRHKVWQQPSAFTGHKVRLVYRQAKLRKRSLLQTFKPSN